MVQHTLLWIVCSDSLNDKPSREDQSDIENANGEVMKIYGQTNLDFEVQGHKFRMPVKVVL